MGRSISCGGFPLKTPSLIQLKKVNFSLEQSMKAQRESRGLLYSFFNPGTR
jgi:hypothetical protein